VNELFSHLYCIFGTSNQWHALLSLASSFCQTRPWYSAFTNPVHTCQVLGDTCRSVIGSWTSRFSKLLPAMQSASQMKSR